MTLYELMDMALTVATDGDEAGLAAIQDAMREEGYPSVADEMVAASVVRRRRLCLDFVFREIDELRRRVHGVYGEIRRTCPCDPMKFLNKKCPECGAVVWG